jgi:hypothetical protein
MRVSKKLPTEIGLLISNGNANEAAGPSRSPTPQRLQGQASFVRLTTAVRRPRRFSPVATVRPRRRFEMETPFEGRVL